MIISMLFFWYVYHPVPAVDPKFCRTTSWKTPTSHRPSASVAPAIDRRGVPWRPIRALARLWNTGKTSGKVNQAVKTMGKTQGKRKMWENREHRKVGSKKDVEKPGTHTKTIGKHEKISGKHRKQNMTFIGTTKMCFLFFFANQGTTISTHSIMSFWTWDDNWE